MDGSSLFFISRFTSCPKLGPKIGKGPLNTKRAPALKKGYGSIGLGRHTNKGFFLIDTRLVPQFRVPNEGVGDMELKPYVSRKTPVISGAEGFWPDRVNNVK